MNLEYLEKMNQKILKRVIIKINKKNGSKRKTN